MPPPSGERFEVRNELTDAQLAGYLDRSSVANCRECVVLCHGYLDSCSGSLMRSLSAGISGSDEDFPGGKNVCRFDFAGNGESSGPWNFGGYWDEVEDLRTIVQHVRLCLGLVVRYLVGHSRGATVVALYAAKYDDVEFVAPVAPRYYMDLGGGVARFSSEQRRLLEENGEFDIVHRGRAFKVTTEGVADRTSLDVGAALDGINKSTLTVVHGQEDAVIPVADGQALVDRVVSRGVSATIIVVPEADHNFRKLRNQLVDVLRGWIITATDLKKYDDENAPNQEAPHLD